MTGERRERNRDLQSDKVIDLNEIFFRRYISRCDLRIVKDTLLYVCVCVFALKCNVLQTNN